MEWLAFGALRSNGVSLQKPPKSTLHIWSNASPTKGGAKTDFGVIFQHNWTHKEAKKHINWLELKVVRLALLQLTSHSDVVQLKLDNMTAIAFIKR